MKVSFVQNSMSMLGIVSTLHHDLLVLDYVYAFNCDGFKSGRDSHSEISAALWLKKDS